MTVTISVRDKIARGDYVSRVPCTIEKVPIDEDTMTIRAAREHKENEHLRAKDQRKAYGADQSRLNGLFRDDLEQENGMKGHPKADRLWAAAYAEGHSNGMDAVAAWYEKLIDLVN